MNEFTRMIQEAFVGAEPFDPSPGREALRASLEQFERRDRVVRVLSWFMVTAMSVFAVWGIWGFWTTPPEAGTKPLLAYATLVLFGVHGIGFAKMFLFNTQKHLSILKELKRVQLALALQDEEANGGDARSG